MEKAQFPGLRVATVNPGSAGDKKPLFVADCRNVTLQQRAELLPSAVVTGDSLAAQQVQIACTVSRYALYGVVKQTVGIVLMPFEDPDAVAVVAVQPFPGTDPDESPFVAVQGIDRDMRKPVIRSQMTERDILCGNTLEKHSQTKQATTQCGQLPAAFRWKNIPKPNKQQHRRRSKMAKDIKQWCISIKQSLFRL